MTGFCKRGSSRQVAVMGDNSEKEADSIVNYHVGFSLVAGAIPIPLADIMAVTAIQLEMIRKIAKVYGVTYNNSYAKSLITSLTGRTLLSSITGKSVAGIGASLLKTLPGIGTAIGVSSQAIISGASTYAVGKVFIYHFSNNGTLSGINKESLRAKYDELYQEGKDYVSKVKADTNFDDPIAALEHFNELKQTGSISEEEYEKIKKELLKKI